MKQNNRKSVSLTWLKNELRNDAIKEQDEELQKKLWRWHYRAKNAEYEVDILVSRAEVRSVLEHAIEHGYLDHELLNLDIEIDTDDEDSEAPPKPKKPKKKPPQDDDNLPKQKGLWDEPPNT